MPAAFVGEGGKHFSSRKSSCSPNNGVTKRKLKLKAKKYKYVPNVLELGSTVVCCISRVGQFELPVFRAWS